MMTTTTTALAYTWYISKLCESNSCTMSIWCLKYEMRLSLNYSQYTTPMTIEMVWDKEEKEWKHPQHQNYKFEELFFFVQILLTSLAHNGAPSSSLTRKTILCDKYISYMCVAFWCFRTNKKRKEITGRRERKTNPKKVSYWWSLTMLFRP